MGSLSTEEDKNYKTYSVIVFPSSVLLNYCKMAMYGIICYKNLK